MFGHCFNWEVGCLDVPRTRYAYMRMRRISARLSGVDEEEDDIGWMSFFIIYLVGCQAEDTRISNNSF